MHQKELVELTHDRAPKIFLIKRGDLETCVCFPIFRELPDAGDGTGRDDHPVVPAQVSPAPLDRILVCQVSVATVKNEYIIFMVSIFVFNQCMV